MVAHKKEERGENQVDDDDQENGHDHGAGGGAADLFGARSGGEALEAADGGDGDTEHDALDESRDDITEKERVKRSRDVADESEVGLSYAEERAAKNAHGIGPNGKAGQHDDHGDEFGGNEKMDGADGHGLESVDLFGDLHGADFGGEGGAGAADDHNGGNQRTKFARHGNGDGGGDVADGAEAAKFIGALQGEDQADEESNEREDGKSADADVQGLRDSTLEADGLALKRSDERVIGGPAAQRSEGAEVGEAVCYGTADLGEELHSRFNAVQNFSGSTAGTRSVRSCSLLAVLPGRLNGHPKVAATSGLGRLTVTANAEFQEDKA